MASGAPTRAKAFAAPAIKVGLAKEQERQRGINGVARQQARSGVEGSPRVVPVTSGGKGFALRSSKPGVGVKVWRCRWRCCWRG